MTNRQCSKTRSLHSIITNAFKKRKSFLDDIFFGRSQVLLTNEQHMRLAVEWLAKAQDSQSDDGVSALYSVTDSWDVSYPETTGYIIPTLLNYYHLTGQSIWRGRAMRMADWLLSIQLSEGGFPERCELRTPLVFDTGQIIFGLIGAYRETKTIKYLDSAIRAVKWLISVQEPTGNWLQYSYGGISHTYYTRVAWALLEVFCEWNDDTLLLAAKKNLNWVNDQQLGNGWFQNSSFSTDEYPSLHTIAYTAQGLLESGKILRDDKYIEAAIKVADTLLVRQKQDGALYGVFDQDWQPPVNWICLTGVAQMSIIWLTLFQLSRNEAYLLAAKKANAYLKSTQKVDSDDPGIKGGIKGSHPINGAYSPYTYPNWATKFFLDALMLENKAAALQDDPKSVGRGFLEVKG